MSKNFDDLLNHPEKDEIISRIIRGETVKSVHDWLSIKYPNPEQKHLRLTHKILKDVITSDFLSYEEQWKKDYEDAQKNISQNKLSAALLNNKSYQERLNEFSEDKLNIKKMLAEMIFVTQQRIEQVFDAIQLSPGEVGKKEYAFINYLNSFFAMMEKYEKIINDRPDQIIQHNISLQAFDQRAFFIQEAIRETLAEMDQEKAMLFMDKLNVKLAALTPPKEEHSSIEKQKKELQKMSHKFDIPLSDTSHRLNSHIPDAEFED